MISHVDSQHLVTLHINMCHLFISHILSLFLLKGLTVWDWLHFLFLFFVEKKKWCQLNTLIYPECKPNIYESAVRLWCMQVLNIFTFLIRQRMIVQKLIACFFSPPWFIHLSLGSTSTTDGSQVITILIPKIQVHNFSQGLRCLTMQSFLIHFNSKRAVVRADYCCLLPYFPYFCLSDGRPLD